METDVLVIGGGATGAGIAWDLALRGVRVILAEMGDLATGTSGRYHGLLHSGARYAVRDPESAKECIDENIILRHIAPEAIEDTGGFFVLCPGDDVAYVDQFLKGCADAGISTRYVPIDEALRREKMLNPRIEAIYEVPDGTCDSWDLLHCLQRGAEATGLATFLTYHKVESFHKTADRITGARLKNLRTGEFLDMTCAVAINAAGPWAGEIGALGGAGFNMKLSRGAMLAYNLRWVNTVINKLRMPGDGDIFVPVGTVSVIGTTSVPTDDPADTRVDSWEVRRILDEAEAMTPGISRARILRSWGGVRPLYDPGVTADGRGAKRTFAVLDHAEMDSIDGFISILGGKLTTFRLMAERVADLACAKLNVTASCTTASTVLPSLHSETRLHLLKDRLDRVEHGEHAGSVICECELVTAPQIRAALHEGARGENDAVALNDIRRDTRLGMGPCQGGFCAYRAAALHHEFLGDTPAHTRDLLTEFVERRIGGMKALLWGHNLRQALLAEHIYGRIVGLSEQPQPYPMPMFSAADLPTRVTHGHPPRIIVIGAGLAGLTAALAAQALGAKVELLAFGQGSLTLQPGWIETGDVTALAVRDDHPYHNAGGSLAAGLALLDDVISLTPVQAGVTLLGTERPVAYAAGLSLRDLSASDRVLVVGINGWRDFYPHVIADTLKARGIDARSLSIPMPHFEGRFDDWAFDFARYLDTFEGQGRLVNTLKESLGGATVVALPALLGFKPDTRWRIENLLGCPILEIPTLPPSIPGLRLFYALRNAILERGGRVTIGAKVVGLSRDSQDGTRLNGVHVETAAHGRNRLYSADAVIMATGGLYGGGLDSDYTGQIWETLAHAAVTGIPAADEAWFSQPVLAVIPQPIHAAGILTDDQHRPLNQSGAPVAANLFAAGRILSGYSPISESSVEGVDIASAVFAAQQAVTAVGRR
jgi:glycerol-3-phosphate dehydrogenase